MSAIKEFSTVIQHNGNNQQHLCNNAHQQCMHVVILETLKLYSMQICFFLHQIYNPYFKIIAAEVRPESSAEICQIFFLGVNTSLPSVPSPPYPKCVLHFSSFYPKGSSRGKCKSIATH